jgi:phage FluMu protein Com
MANPNFMKLFRSLPEEKRDKYLRLIFVDSRRKKATQTPSTSEKTSNEAGTGVYQCPRCGNEDHTLAYWRKYQTREEKWDQHVNEWYQKKKCERKLAAEKSKVSKTPRAELFAKLKSMTEFSNEMEIKLNKCKDLETELNKSFDRKEIEKSPRPEPRAIKNTAMPEPEKSPRFKSRLQSSETEFISPVGQRAILQLDALKSYSQEVQEKIDAANNLEVPNEEAENSFLTSTRFSDVEDLDESELRDAPNKDDSLFEGFSMTHVSMVPTNISMPKEGDATIASWRNDTQASPKSPQSEASLVGKSGFTHLITSPKERSEPEMVSIIEEPEIQSNLLLPAESEFQRTKPSLRRVGHLETIHEKRSLLTRVKSHYQFFHRYNKNRKRKRSLLTKKKCQIGGFYLRK